MEHFEAAQYDEIRASGDPRAAARYACVDGVTAAIL
jgi:hypothetical protein